MNNKIIAEKCNVFTDELNTNLIDINNIPQNFRAYGGVSCQKIGITLNSKNYLVKFPGNLKSRNLQNIQLSYSNGPICEFIGSHIFQFLGINAHNTFLGIRADKLVVLCEDFLKPQERLYEFRVLKSTYEPSFYNSKGELTDGSGSKLSEAITVIQNHPFFQSLDEAENIFWKMFIVDAIIGNPDRNNGNWGLIIDDKDCFRIAPVFDNGNCLNNKWEDEKMSYFMRDNNLFINEAFKGKICFFTNDKEKKMNPFHLIESNQYPKCTQALNEVLQAWNWNKIEKFINSISLLSEIQNTFYKKILLTRFEELQRISCVIGGV